MSDDVIFYNKIELFGVLVSVDELASGEQSFVVETRETYKDGLYVERHEVRCFSPRMKKLLADNGCLNQPIYVRGRMRRTDAADVASHCYVSANDIMKTMPVFS